MGIFKYNVDTIQTLRKMASKYTVLFMVFLIFMANGPVEAGPIMAGSAVSACYTACNAAYVTCMGASGLVAGATGPVGWWAWLTGAAATCSATQGACMAACT